MTEVAAAVRALDYRLIAEQELQRALLQALLLNAATPGAGPITLYELKRQVMAFVVANGARPGSDPDDNALLDDLAMHRVTELFGAVEVALNATCGAPYASLPN